MAQDDEMDINNDTSFDEDLDIDKTRTDTTGLNDDDMLDDRDSAL